MTTFDSWCVVPQTDKRRYLPRLVCLVLLLLGVVAPSSALLAQTSPPVRPGSYADRMSKSPSLTPNSSADSLYMIARRALNRRSYDTAIVVFREVADLHPVSYVAPNAWYWLAYTLHRRGEEKNSLADLTAARDAILVHRMLYEDSPTRGDANELSRQVQTAVVAMGGPSATERMLRGYFDSCPVTTVEVTPSIFVGLDKLPTLEAVERLARSVFGEGMCFDVTAAGPLYTRLGTFKRGKQQVIAALGRSMHPSAVRELRAIVGLEGDPELKALAREWLLFHAGVQ